MHLVNKGRKRPPRVVLNRPLGTAAAATDAVIVFVHCGLCRVPSEINSLMSTAW